MNIKCHTSNTYELNKYTNMTSEHYIEDQSYEYIKNRQQWKKYEDRRVLTNYKEVIKI